MSGFSTSTNINDFTFCLASSHLILSRDHFTANVFHPYVREEYYYVDIDNYLSN